MKNIIFLDVDGVFNCQLFYEKEFGHLIKYDNIPFYRTVKRFLKKLFHQKQMSGLDYYKSQICPDRMAMFNQLCQDANAVVVLSASMRSGKSIERLNEIFKYCGATFEIIDKTGYTGYERGTEISQWLKKNITPETYGCYYYEFYNYAIIDDDSDMLLNQQEHFFKTDNYSGLTPNTCWKIKHFFTHRYFDDGKQIYCSFCDTRLKNEDYEVKNTLYLSCKTHRRLAEIETERYINENPEHKNWQEEKEKEEEI